MGEMRNKLSASQILPCLYIVVVYVNMNYCVLMALNYFYYEKGTCECMPVYLPHYGYVINLPNIPSR